jgi:beta-fructofuranosidase
MSKMQTPTSGIFYRPLDGVAADFIPFYWEGVYHLFYLKDYRDPDQHGEGTPWSHLATRDFVEFDDWGEALPRGTPGDPDLYVFTGSVVAGHDGLFHIFYTGHNPHLQAQGQPVQLVMHASSSDLRIWHKDPDFRFRAPTTAGYEPDDWRDPFVFWNPQAGEYWMLLAARLAQGPSRHRGLTALAASRDLQTWEVRPPLWSPSLYFTHECPDLFRIGDWWYLLYSTFSERCVTHYRMSRSLEGPWLAPADDQLDGRAFYAAKSAGPQLIQKPGEPRYLFGWLPTRSGEKDDGEWNWGGNLVVHALQQQPGGSLSVSAPATVKDQFKRAKSLQPSPFNGCWQISGNRCISDSSERFSALLLSEMPLECRLDLAITCQPGTATAGLLLRADSGLESYYQVRLEPARQRLVVDRWPRPGDQPFMLERPLAQQAGQPTRLSLYASDSCLVIYANDTIALSCRMYDHPTGAIGLFACEGGVSFEQIGLFTHS